MEPRETFEETLEAKLLAKEAGRRWSWAWLNAPITLWALTTVAVGIISFFVTQNSKCSESLEADTTKFLKLSTELEVRVGELYGATASPGDFPGKRATTLYMLDPERNYILSEFKGKATSELVAEISLLYRKWDTDAYTAWNHFRETDTAPKLLELEEQMTGNADPAKPFSVRKYVERYADISVIAGTRLEELGFPEGNAFRALDLINLWLVAQRLLAAAPTNEAFDATWAWTRRLGTLIRNVPDFDLAPPYTCVQRSLWPF
jgi:hypothetical protein